MRVMTVKKLVQTIKAMDTNSAINENMLKALFDAKKVQSWQHGNRTVTDVDILIRDLNRILGLNENTSIPRLRSIHDAFFELRSSNPDLGVSEERIRFLISAHKLPCIRAGNRAYIALESFTPPYDQCLICDDGIDNRSDLKEQIREQQLQKYLAKHKKR